MYKHNERLPISMTYNGIQMKLSCRDYRGRLKPLAHTIYQNAFVKWPKMAENVEVIYMSENKSTLASGGQPVGRLSLPVAMCLLHLQLIDNIGTFTANFEVAEGGR